MLIDDDERRRRLVARHGLVEPFADPVDVADRLVGIHSSDPATVFLTVRSRLPDLAVSDLERTLYDDAVLLRFHAMRRTLWVASRRMADLMFHAAAVDVHAAEFRRTVKMMESAGFAGAAASLEQMSARVVEVIGDGELSTSEINAALPELDHTIPVGSGKWAGSVPMGSRVLLLTAMNRMIERTAPAGSWVSSQYRWRVPVAPPAAMAGDDARAELVTAWLRSYGPGTLTDISWWGGWGIGKTRRALSVIDVEEVELADGREAFVLTGDREVTPPQPTSVTLVPSLDSTVMGWKERDWFLGPHVGELFDTNGNAGPVVFVDGRLVGAWGQTADGEVVTELFEDVDPVALDVLAERGRELTRWLDGTIISPRFPSPASRRLKP